MPNLEITGLGGQIRLEKIGKKYRNIGGVSRIVGDNRSAD